MTSPYQAAEALERLLGDPGDPRTPWSFKQAVALDEQEAYPSEACKLLNQWGLQEYYIPAELGGKLRSFEESLALLRVVARRDLTVAIAHGKSYLGAVAVWVSGNLKQQQRLAALIRRGAQISLALTERDHGSDLAANEVVATRTGEGYLLSGEKWLINNATRGEALTIYARTDAAGGPRGFSLLLIEKAALPEGCYTPLPKVKTHGIRGADISGLRLTACPVSAQALVGEEGLALETTLRALQLTRTACAGLSLGAADTALRIAASFARTRRLYGGTVAEIPHARRELAYAYSDLLICECMTIAAMRGLHVAPEQFSVWSAVIKYAVPTRVEQLIQRLSVLLGARSYLREDHAWGMFQKIARDNAIVGLFDGSTIVNLQALGSQLRSLARQRRQQPEQPDAQLSARLGQIFNLGQELPPARLERLDLFNDGQDVVIHGLGVAAAQLAELAQAAGSQDQVIAELSTLTQALVSELGQYEEALAQVARSYGRELHRAPELFDLAKTYCLFHAAAACIQIWLHSRAQLSPPFERGAWVAFCLRRILSELRPAYADGQGTPHIDEVVAALFAQEQGGWLFSLIPVRLAESRTSNEEI